MAEFVPFIVSNFEIKLASTKDEFDDVYRLRYEELLLSYNKDNTNESGMFIDEYDPHCDHLIAIDLNTKRVVGTYRLVRKKHIKSIGHFITETEYDISKIKKYEIMELGRAVVKEEYRNGSIIMLLWKGLIRYATMNNIKYMFGTGSFHGINPQDYDQALSYLYYNHLSPIEVRAKALSNSRSDINLIPISELDIRKIKQQMPPLIKGYLKIGATFGEDAFLDISFNSLDVFVLFDVENVNPKYLQRFLADN